MSKAALKSVPADVESSLQISRENADRAHVSYNAPIADIHPQPTTAVTPIENVPIAMSPTIGKLAGALAQAQSKIRFAIKDSENPYFNSDYADLTSVVTVIYEVAPAVGLALSQHVTVEGNKVSISTMVLHESGEFLMSTLTMAAADASPQKVGSTITYGRRYGAAAVFGVAPANEDDDGNANGAPPQKPQPQPAAAKPTGPGSKAPAAKAPANKPEQAKPVAQIYDAKICGHFHDKSVKGEADITYLGIRAMIDEKSVAIKHQLGTTDDSPTLEEILETVDGVTDGIDESVNGKFDEPIPCRVTAIFDPRKKTYTITEFGAPTE